MGMDWDFNGFSDQWCKGARVLKALGLDGFMNNGSLCLCGMIFAYGDVLWPSAWMVIGQWHFDVLVQMQLESCAWD